MKTKHAVQPVVLAAVAAIVLSADWGFAANAFWNSGDGLYQTGSNWTPSAVPGVNDSAFLRSGSAIVITSTTSQTVNTLAVGSQALDANDKGNVALSLGSTMLTVTGSGVTYAVDFTSGASGGGKTLRINSGSLSTTNVRIQQNASSAVSEMYITGTGSNFTTAGKAGQLAYQNYNLLGGNGSANVYIQSGGVFSVFNSSTDLGSGSTGAGYLQITGAGSAFAGSSTNTGLGRLAFFVGSSGTGTLVVENGGSFSTDDLNVARNASASGSVTVSDSGSVLAAGRLMIGGGANNGAQSPSAGGNGIVTVSNSGVVNAGSVYVLKGGSTSGTLALNNGTVNVTSDQMYLDGVLSGNGSVSGTVRLNLAGATIAANGGALSLTSLVAATNGTISSGSVSVSGVTSISNNQTLTVNGVLGGAGGLTFGGAGSILSGTGMVSKAVTLTGQTLSSSGTLGLGSTLDVGAGGGTISGGAVSVNGTTTVNASRTLTNNGTLAGAGNLVVSGTISGSGSVNKTGGTINGGGVIAQAVILGGNTTLGTLVLNSTLGVSGAGNSVSSGASPAISGATTINSGGALAVNGTLGGAGAMTVNGVLSGTGSVNKAVTVTSQGTLSPGNSPGNLNVASLTLDAGGNYNWQAYDATGTAGSGFDTITLSGALDLTGLSTSSKFNINLWSLSSINPDSNGNAINFDNSVGQSWVLVDAASINTSGLINPISDYFVVNIGANNGTAGFTNDLNGGSFYVSVNGGDLQLNFVPEPSAYLLAGLGMIAVLFFRKKKA